MLLTNFSSSVVKIVTTYILYDIYSSFVKLNDYFSYTLSTFNLFTVKVKSEINIVNIANAKIGT